MSNTLKLGNGKWATGKDTLLSFSDTNNNYKPLAFSFSRDSSATVINKDGLIETVGSGEPRIDFKDNTKGALKLEPSRTNLLIHSNDFSQSEWNKQAIGTASLPVVTSNYGISPDGTQNADRLQLNLNGGTTSADLSYMTDYLTATGTTTTSSVYIKSLNSITNIGIRTGSVIKSIDVGTEWQRFDVSDLTSSNRFQFLLYGHLNSQSADLLIYGAQLEQGSYATSYIPTSGSAVTRVKDTTSQTPPDGVIGQTEGVIYWEGIINGFDVNFSNIVTGEKNTTTSFAVLHKGSSSQFQCSVFDGSEKGKCIGGSVSVGETCKIAYAYKSGNFALYVNGVSVAISTDTWTPPSTIDDIYIGDTTSYFGNKESNTHKEVKLYNTRLSNAELQALTTI